MNNPPSFVPLVVPIFFFFFFFWYVDINLNFKADYKFDDVSKTQWSVMRFLEINIRLNKTYYIMISIYFVMAKFFQITRITLKK